MACNVLLCRRSTDTLSRTRRLAAARAKRGGEFVPPARTHAVARARTRQRAPLTARPLLLPPGSSSWRRRSRPVQAARGGARGRPRGLRRAKTHEAHALRPRAPPARSARALRHAHASKNLTQLYLVCLNVHSKPSTFAAVLEALTAHATTRGALARRRALRPRAPPARLRPRACQ